MTRTTKEEVADEIHLSEHETSDPYAPGVFSEDDLDVLETLVNEGETRRIGVEFDRDGYVSIRTGSYVGVVGLPDGPTIQIEPKAAAGNLISMLLFAHRTMADPIETEAHLQEGARFVDAFAALFLTELESVITQGLHREYVEIQGSESYLRGRLNLQRQLQRHPVAPTSFETDHDEYTYDTLLNQAVLHATKTLASFVRTPDIAGQLRERASTIERRVTHRPVSIGEVERLELTRLNDHYERIIRLAELVLRGSFAEDMRAGSRRAYSMLINMNGVFERVVEGAIECVTDSRAGWTVRTQAPTDSLLQGTPRIRMYPDLILSIDGDVVLVGDAKWKTHRSNSDIYQLLAYQSAYEVPGVLVFPQQQGAVETTYSVDGGHDLHLYELPTQVATRNFEDFATQLTSAIGEKIDAILANRR